MYCSQRDYFDKTYPGYVVLCHRIWIPSFAGTARQVLVVDGNCIVQGSVVSYCETFR